MKINYDISGDSEMELTIDSLALMRKISEAASEYDDTAGCFLAGELTKAETGNLTDLKKKGLADSYEDHGPSGKFIWIELSERGRELLGEEN